MCKTLRTVLGTKQSPIKLQEVNGNFWVVWSELRFRKINLVEWCRGEHTDVGKLWQIFMKSIQGLNEMTVKNGKKLRYCRIWINRIEQMTKCGNQRAKGVKNDPLIFNLEENGSARNRKRTMWAWLIKKVLLQFI